MPAQLAEGLHILQAPLNDKEPVIIEVHSIKKEFGQGAKDEDWISKLGGKNAVVITQDYNIQKTRHQRQLYEEAGIGMFFLGSSAKKGTGYWEMTKKLVKEWEAIKKIIRKETPPFAYRATARTKFEKL